MQPTKQQQDITEYFVRCLKKQVRSVGKPTSIVALARAGAGKTSEIVMLLKKLKEHEEEIGKVLRSVCISFNKVIQIEMKKKIEDFRGSSYAMTTNSFGRYLLDQAAKRGKCAAPGTLDEDKYDTLIKDFFKQYRSPFFMDEEEYNDAVKAANLLVSGVRLTCCQADRDSLEDLVLHYALEIDLSARYWDSVVLCVQSVLVTGRRAYQEGYSTRITTKRGKVVDLNYAPGWHDFNDQVCLPLELPDIILPIYDVICFDEAQDACEARKRLAERAVKKNGILFWVGDDRQAIQGFCFADTNSMQNIIEGTGAVLFPLTVCFRCNKKIIDLAKILVPDIQALPDAKDGTIETISETSFYEMLQPGKNGADPHFIVGRMNHIVVEACFAAIRMGKQAIVRGRDIGKSMTALFKKVIKSETNLFMLQELLDIYSANEQVKIRSKKNAEKRLIAFLDRIKTLEVLFENYLDMHVGPMTNDDFITFIESKFDDKILRSNGITPIIFSTIHKAKGLEYKTVFIIGPDALPHPLAKVAWQRLQEENLIYVAVTRAKEAVYFVDYAPKILAKKVEELCEKVAA